METIPILIQSNEKWDDNKNYVDFEPSGELIPRNCKYEELVHTLLLQLRCNPATTQMQLQYQVKDDYPPLKIVDDASLLFYLQLKMNESDFTRYPLCVNTVDNMATTSNQIPFYAYKEPTITTD